MSYALWDPEETGLIHRADGSYGNTFLDGSELPGELYQMDELKEGIINVKKESCEQIKELTHKIQELQRVLDEHVNK